MTLIDAVTKKPLKIKCELLDCLKVSTCRLMYIEKACKNYIKNREAEKCGAIIAKDT